MVEFQPLPIGSPDRAHETFGVGIIGMRSDKHFNSVQ